MVKQRLGKLGLAPILAKPPSSLPSFHPSTTLPPTPPPLSSSPLFSLSFPFTPIYLPLSSRVTTSEPFYHNVQKRSAAIQPRRGCCLFHWPDRFGEFSLHSLPSHPVLRVPIPTYNHLYHLQQQHYPIYLNNNYNQYSIEFFTQWILKCLSIPFFHLPIPILPGRS